MVFFLQLLVFQKQNVIVKGDGLHLGVPFLHSAKSQVNGTQGDG